MLVALLAGLLLAAPAPRPTAPPPTACAAPLGMIGPHAAPLTVRWYFDPVILGAHELWLELHRLVADYDGLVQVRPILVVSAVHNEQHHRDARRWLVAAAQLGRAEEALHRLDVDGPERFAAQLRVAPERIAALLDLPIADVQRALDDPCIDQTLARGSVELRRAIHHNQLRAGRPPAFAIGALPVFEDGARLDGVRREIEHALRRQPAQRPSPRRERAISPRLARPPAAVGMLVGGIAPPHRLVLFAEQEDHPVFVLLAPVLGLRARRPGSLAIQVIARGPSANAVRLRRRLCAARHLGAELEYVRVLALDYGADTPRARDLRDRLDAAAERQRCGEDEERLEAAEDAPLALPEGIWLDGAALGQRELGAIEREILSIERAVQPLDAVFSPAAPPET
jgi:hypothetical protein